MDHAVCGEVLVYFRDPDGARVELVVDPLGGMCGDKVP
ncbi:VOC family protein [Streptomyces adustus]